MDCLFVIDYQNDFVDGALGFPGAETLDAANQAKGQGLIHIFSNGVGPAVMTAVSGTLVDRVDVNAMLLFNAAAAVVGLLVVALATSGYFDKRSKEK